MSYELIFDDDQRQVATSIAQVVQCLFSYLSAQCEVYQDDFETDSNERVTIVCYEPDATAERLKPCSQAHAKWLLQQYDEIDLYAQGVNIGLFASAKAKVNNMSTPEKQIERDIRRLLAHDGNDQSWKPTEVTPIQIIQATEVRLFATRLKIELEKSQVSLDFVDQQCNFAFGTCQRLTHPTDPLKPTTTMVDKLARFLKIKPIALWVEMLPFYLDCTGEWDLYR